MADSTLVSVVIAAEAFAGAIEGTLRSVRMQSHEHWEALVVHPRGAEDSLRAMANASREDTRIRLIEDAGARSAHAARNAAVHAAGGEWMAFLEPLDTLLPHSLEARLDVAKSQDVLVVHSEGCLLRTDGPHLYGVPPLAGWVYRELLEHEGPPFSALLVHRDAMRSVGPVDERLAAFHAWDLAIRLARTHRFGFEPTPSFGRDVEAVMARSHASEGTGYEQVLRKHFAPMLRQAGIKLPKA